MGMFDYLRCDVPLPDGRIEPGPVWQTKDSPCEMGLVVISADGRLLYQEAHYESVPEEQRPYYGKPEWNGERSGIWRACGSMNRVIDRVYDADYHGDVRFYRCGNDTSDWEEYSARFTDGQLSRISKVDTGHGDDFAGRGVVERSDA